MSEFRLRPAEPRTAKSAEASGRAEVSEAERRKLEAALEGLKALVKTERDGWINAFSNNVLDRLSARGVHTERDLKAAELGLERALSDGQLTQGEAAIVRRLLAGAREEVRGYVHLKETAGAVAGTTAAAVAASTGVGLPAAIAYGAAGSVVGNFAMEGGGYTFKDGMLDAATGAVGAGMGQAVSGMGLGAKAAARVAGVPINGAVRTVASPLADGVRWGVDSAATAAAWSLPINSMDPATWDAGLAEGVKRVAVHTGLSAGLGGVLGGTAGATVGKAQKMREAADPVIDAAPAAPAATVAAVNAGQDE